MLSYVNGRMSIVARLVVLCLLFTLPVALGVWLFVQQASKDIAFARKEVAGDHYLMSVWPAVLGAAALAHDDAAESMFGVAEAAQALRDTKTPAARFSKGASLLDAVANSSNLTLDTDLDSYYAQDAATERLPAILVASEGLDAALAESGPDRKAAIAVALSKLAEAADAAKTSLTSAMKNNRSGRSGAVLQTSTQNLESSVAKRLGAGKSAEDAPTATPTNDTEQAALANAVDQSWRATAGELDRLLEVRISQLTREMVTDLVLFALATTAASGLAFFVATGLSGRIGAQVRAMERLAAGEISIEIPYLGDRNETGRVAAALLVFKNSLVERNRLRAQSEDVHRAAEEKLQDVESEFRAAAAAQTQVVQVLSASLQRLAEGDLCSTAPEDVAADYKGLSQDFNTATAALSAALGKVRDSSDSIGRGASEIAQASDDLSRRTEQQAAALEQTAAALEQITATVRRSAESAVQAATVVSTAQIDAVRSGSIVAEAMTAMGEIERSSAEIGQILGVIDEIAFQTNLLALNAGVEAARAGDAGRGFAVVAQEVRALAQRSADAAREIKALIGGSTAQVAQGVRRVKETGEALSGIVAKVSDIDGLMRDIATSSQEQAAGLHQVSSAVNQMDQVTQQNAAMVEQATAAVQTLRAEAGQLARLVTGFTLGAPSTLQRADTGQSPLGDNPVARNQLRRAGARG